MASRPSSSRSALTLTLTLTTIVALLAGLLVLATAAPASATDRISRLDGFNARAWTVTAPDANGVRYVGGDFTSFQPWATGKAARLSTSDGAVDTAFPAVSGGSVYTVAPDGTGGVVIGGTFSAVDGQPRSRLARILADGTVDPDFAPNPNSDVFTVAVTGTTVLAGGRFGTIAGQSRANVAAVDLETGAALNWNPAADAWVMSLTVVGDVVYLGGTFGALGTLARTRLAAVRLDARTAPASGTCLDAYDETDCVTDFAPTISNYGVDDVAVTGTTLYAAGYFDMTGTVGTRSHLVAMSRDTVADNAGLLAWNPAPSHQVRALTVANDRLYAVGDFTTIDSVSRGRGASYDITTPTAPVLTSWDPQAVPAGTYNNARQISDVAIDGSTAYLTGNFWSVDGEPRNRLASVDASTGAATSWDPHICDYSNGVSSTTMELAVIGSQVVVGGDFDCAGGLQRRHAAAVGADGILTSWAPAVDGPVFAFDSNGSTIYMTGSFAQVTGTGGTGGGRTNAAAVGTDGAVTSWDPAPNGRPTDVIVSGSSVYLAGFFTSVGGSSQSWVAKVDSSTGSRDTGFSPALDAAAEHMALKDGRLYLAGRFTTAGGQARVNYAAVDAASGALDAWNVGTVTASNDTETHGRGLIGTAIAASGDRVFIGGSFLGIIPAGESSTVTQRYVAATDAVTGELDLTWRPATIRGNNGNGDVYTIAATDDAIYLGGQNDFSITDGVGTRQRLAAVDPTTGALLPWNPQAGAGEIRGLSPSTAAVFVVGSFDSLGGATRYNSGAIAVDGTLLDPWPLNPSLAEPVAVTTQVTAGSATAVGAVTSSPPGITCEDGSDSCAYGFPVGQTVTLTAVPAASFDFVEWQGDCSGTSTTCTVTITSGTTISARFADRGYVAPSDPATGGGGSSSSSSSSSSTGSTSSGTATANPTAPATPSVANSGEVRSITVRKGKRARVGTVDRIRVAITTEDLAPGTILRPWIKLGPKSARFKQGKARVVVREDGAATWNRKVPASKRATVYFVVQGTEPPVTSNRVSWKARAPRR